jgi:hypothetical protein
MKSSVIHFDRIKVDEVTVVALKNGVKLTQQNLTELAFKIASDSLKYLDNNSFEQITGLKK